MKNVNHFFYLFQKIFILLWGKAAVLICGFSLMCRYFCDSLHTFLYSFKRIYVDGVFLDKIDFENKKIRKAISLEVISLNMLHERILTPLKRILN